MWRRRALSRRVRTSTRNNALGAGTIVAPGAWAWLTRGSKCTRANKGRQSPPPATRGRRRRPGARLNARAAATTVGSGTAGGGAGGRLWGSPQGGGAQQGGNLARVHWGTNPADQRAPRGLAIAQLLGDIVQATPCNADGPPRFVLAGIGRNGCQKETTAARVIQAPNLRKMDRFSPCCGEYKG